MAAFRSAMQQLHLTTQHLKKFSQTRLSTTKKIYGFWQQAQRLLTGLFMAVSSLWLSCALWVQLSLITWLKWLIIGLWSLFTLLVGILVVKSGDFQLSLILWATYLMSFTAGLLWWKRIQPSNHRLWAADVEQLLEIEYQGDQVTLHNVRNFDWRSEHDFTPRWETRHYDLSKLATLDVITSYWMGPLIAHVLVSFGFSDGKYLTFSIETRKEQHEHFSLIGGFFRMYDLSLIAADEKDILFTRSNVRQEQVFLYRTNLKPSDIKLLFNSYLKKADELRHQPRFYNSLISNCTTIAFNMAKSIAPWLPFDYRILLSGYLPEYLYEKAALDARYSLAELRRRGYINPYAIQFAKASGQSSRDYSNAIRQGIFTL